MLQSMGSHRVDMTEQLNTYMPRYLRMEIQSKLLFFLKTCILGKPIIYLVHFLVVIYQMTESL